MKVCVTGANGFVGSNLCRHLLAEGLPVAGLVRPTSDLGYLEGLSGLELHTGDLASPAALATFLKGATQLYSVAAFTLDRGPWADFRAANVDGVRNLMEAARSQGVCRVVHVSTVAVLGFPAGIDLDEDTAPVERRNEPYIESKRRGEEIVLAHAGRGLQVAVIRPATIYGPNDRTTMLRMLPELERRRLPLVGGGRFLMSPVYIDNLVELMRLAARPDTPAGRVYNAADAGRTTWADFLGGLARAIGAPPPRLSIPAPLAFGLAALVEDVGRLLRLEKPPELNRFRLRAVCQHNHHSIARARRELGYAPRVSTVEGIERTAAWYLGLAGKGS